MAIRFSSISTSEVDAPAAHCIDILTRLAIGRGYDGSVFSYDFRVYSLFLLGLVLVGAGVQLLRALLG
jgi:hypothetical protein